MTDVKLEALAWQYEATETVVLFMDGYKPTAAWCPLCTPESAQQAVAAAITKCKELLG